MKENKTALITGSGKRIGASISRAFHSRGYNIIAHFNSSSKDIKSLEKDLNKKRKGSCIAFQADFFEKESLKKFIENILKKTNRLDVLVNNASTFFPKKLSESSEEDLNNLYQTNSFVPFFLIKAFEHLLRESSGSVVNLSDSMVKGGIKEYSLYTAAKSSLESLTKSLAKELGPEIRVNAVAPGIILWPEDEELSEESKEKLVEKTALRRVGSPEDIANAVLMVHELDYMTGQILNVDGGREN
tara:strand:- start:1149 stop:1880 length:732 start_codon:yes stop_codon:yes gene_type:complete